MQAGFAVQVLALEPEVLLLDEMRLAHFLQGIAPDLITRLPDSFAAVFAQLPRHAVEIVVVVANLLLRTSAVNPGQRFVAVLDIQVQAGLAVAVFL
ncbi:hypothetical protein D3C79_636550 [compost metagenome]